MTDSEGNLLYKPWRVVTSSRKMADALNRRRCSHPREAHQTIEGSKRVGQSAAYPRQMTRELAQLMVGNLTGDEAYVSWCDEVRGAVMPVNVTGEPDDEGMEAEVKMKNRRRSLHLCHHRRSHCRRKRQSRQWTKRTLSSPKARRGELMHISTDSTATPDITQQRRWLDIYNDMERTQQLCDEREPFDVRIAKPASDQEHECPPV